MKEIDKLNDNFQNDHIKNGCTLSFYVNLEACGLDEDGMTAEDYDHVIYYIKEGKLFYEDGEELLNIDEIDYEDNASWFENFIDSLVDTIVKQDLTGIYEFCDMIEDEFILTVTAKDVNDNIIERIDEWDISRL